MSTALYVLTGHISEPKHAVTQGKGTSILTFGLAFQASKDAETVWHNCLISGKFADAMRPHLKKGSKVYIEGTPSVKTNTKEGKSYKNETVFVNVLRLMDDKKEGAEAGYAPPPAAVPAASEANGFDDDIPF